MAGSRLWNCLPAYIFTRSSRKLLKFSLRSRLRLPKGNLLRVLVALIKPCTIPCQLYNVIREVIKVKVMMDGGGQMVGDGVGYPRRQCTSKTYSWTKDSIDKGYVHKMFNHSSINI